MGIERTRWMRVRRWLAKIVVRVTSVFYEPLLRLEYWLFVTSDSYQELVERVAEERQEREKRAQEATTYYVLLPEYEEEEETDERLLN